MSDCAVLGDWDGSQVYGAGDAALASREGELDADGEAVAGMLTDCWKRLSRRQENWRRD